MSPQPTRAKPAKGGRYAETPPLVGPPLAAKSRGDVPAGPPIPPVASEPETVGRKWGRVRLRGHAPGAFDYAASNEPPIDLPVAGEGRRAGRGGRVSKANHLDLYLGQRHVGLRSVALGTTDVARTSRRVSEVLKRNRILPLAANSNGVVDELAMRTTSRSNSFYNVRPSPDVNQIVFYVTEGQAGEIVEQLQAIETTETLALDALRSPRARAAGAPKTQVEFNIAAADDVVELNARIENRGTRPSGTDGMGMGGMGMGGMGMGGAAFGGGRGGGGPSSPAQQAVESDRDGEHLAQASELANRSMMLRPKPGGPVVSGSGAGDDAKRDAEVHDTMSEQAGSRLDMTMGTRFAGVPERSEQMGRGIVTQARQQVTRGMGRLVQVVVTISKRGSVATSKPSTPTTQPAPATQPSPTSAPAAR